MASKSKVDHHNNKRIKIEDGVKNLTIFGATCSNFVVDLDSFKNKLLKFSEKQLDDYSVQACHWSRARKL